MPRTPEHLSAGEWAVLALLSEAPAHGFALARALQPRGEVGRVWSLPRPLVYRALDTLIRLGLAAAGGTEPGDSGPPRTVMNATPDGESRVRGWLCEPVEHVRDARSLLLLKLLFHDRRGDDPRALLDAQRSLFRVLVERLDARVQGAAGFERTLLLWRLKNASAAVRFVDRLLEQSAVRAPPT